MESPPLHLGTGLLRVLGASRVGRQQAGQGPLVQGCGQHKHPRAGKRSRGGSGQLRSLLCGRYPQQNLAALSPPAKGLFPLWGGSGEPRGSRELCPRPAFPSGWASGRGAPRGGPGPRPPAPRRTCLRARRAGPYSGHHEAAFPSRSRPQSGGQSLPFSSPPASYPAGACPGGRPFIHRAAAPAEATKPAWQREAPRSSGRRLRLLTFTRRPRLRHPASLVGPGAVETAGRRSPPSSSSSSSRPAPPRPAEGRRPWAGRSCPGRLCWVPPQLLGSRQLRG